VTHPDAPCIMVVENDVQFLYLMRRYVHRSGCRLVCTTCTDDVLLVAQQERPALIMLNMLLPDDSSWTTLRALKADSNIVHIPVVLYAAEEESVRGWEHYAEFYLLKPVMYEDFLMALSDTGIRLPS